MLISHNIKIKNMKAKKEIKRISINVEPCGVKANRINI